MREDRAEWPRQRGTIAAMSEVDLSSLLTVEDFERAAAGALSPVALRYFSSGADAEHTLRENQAAFARWAIYYKVLVDVSARDLHTTVLGSRVESPILIAPTAYHKLAHPDGELATARAAQEAGTVYVMSTLATTTIEEVARATPGAPRWFQLYVHKDAGLTRALVARAAAAGHTAIVVTVDTPMLGRRLQDERHGFALPEGMAMVNLLAEEAPTTGSALAAYVADRHESALTWKHVEQLRSSTALPIVLKGIVRADDARRAADVGVAAVIVSNHGGRQLDGAPATIDALPAIADAVAGRCEVLMDGGVRWGTDVLRALALGARAVLVGRPVLWGLAAGGQAGVARVLQILSAELSRAMALAGCAKIGDITRDLVRSVGT